MISATDRILAFAHPVVGILALVLLFRAASFGLRSRERGGATLRPRHRTAAPLAYVATLVTFLMGLSSTWLWRPDLDIASSWHFRIGILIITLLSFGAMLSARIPKSPRAKALHPVIGMIALLLAALQVFFGMPLLRF